MARTPQVPHVPTLLTSFFLGFRNSKGVGHTHTHTHIYIYIHICKFVPVFKDVRTVQSLSYRSVGFSPTLPALVAVGRRKEEQNQEEVSKSELQ